MCSVQRRKFIWFLKLLQNYQTIYIAEVQKNLNQIFTNWYSIEMRKFAAKFLVKSFFLGKKSKCILANRKFNTFYHAQKLNFINLLDFEFFKINSPLNSLIHVRLISFCLILSVRRTLDVSAHRILILYFKVYLKF